MPGAGFKTVMMTTRRISPWATMADPDGNQFCVVQQPPGD